MRSQARYGRGCRLIIALWFTLAATPLAGCLSSETFEAHSQYVWETAALLEYGGDNAIGGDYPTRTLSALGSSQRQRGERREDRVRGTASIVGFAGLDQGQSVAAFSDDFLIRAISAVVGREGSITVWRPTELVRTHGNVRGNSEAVERLRNVSIDHSAPAALSLPSGLDVVLSADTHHALHIEGLPHGTAAAVNAAVFRALLPGGSYVIIDVHAADGSGTSGVDRLHRIEVASVIAEVEAAGFVLEDQEGLFTAAEDARTAPAYPAAGPRSTRFLLKFRKPRRPALEDMP